MDGQPHFNSTPEYGQVESICFDNVHSLLARAATLGARLMKLVIIELGTLFSS